jgi:hypothetical protein
MEEQGAAGRAERQVAEFVEDAEVGAGEAPRDLSGLSLKLFLFEGVDELDGGEEPDALAVALDGLDADRSGEMRLARAGAADQDDIVGVSQEFAAMELTRERLVDLTAGEVEAGEIAIVRKASGLELIGRRSDLPVGRLRLQELLQDRRRGLEGWGALLGQLADGLCHAVQRKPGALRNGAPFAELRRPSGLCNSACSRRLAKDAGTL